MIKTRTYEDSLLLIPPGDDWQEQSKPVAFLLINSFILLRALVNFKFPNSPSMMKLFGFPLSSSKLFFSFQVFTPEILQLSAFSFQFSIEILRFTKNIIFSQELQRAKNWRKIKLLGFRFHHQNFFQLSAFYTQNSLILRLSAVSS